MGATRAGSAFFPVAAERFDGVVGRGERPARSVDDGLRGGMFRRGGREEVCGALNVPGRRSKVGFMQHALFCGESVDRRTTCNVGLLPSDDQSRLSTLTTFFRFIFSLLGHFKSGDRRVTGSHALGEEEVGQVHGADRTGVGDGGPNANPC